MNRRITKLIVLTIAAVIALLFGTLPRSSGQAPAPKEGTYKVVRVTDGDTVVLDMENKNVTVRLIGLNTPETVDPRRPVQCFGKEASDKAKEILSHTNVRVELDPTQGTYDKYSRLLAYLFIPSKTGAASSTDLLFNQHMIEQGYGYEYTYNLPYKYQKEFKAAERNARTEKKGLWADDACKQ